MSRIIKFRMWNCVIDSPDLSCMIYDIDEVIECLKQQLIYDSKIPTSIGYNHRGDGSEFMQFTGLLDKNGVEVYEKDILGGLYESGYIDYCQQCKGFQYHLVDFGCMACEGDIFWHELVTAPHEVEVIGNVFQNPEMLQP